MAAIKMEQLVKLEGQHGLSADGLTYQQRLARIKVVQAGGSWTEPKAEEPRRGNVTRVQQHTPASAVPLHPLYGKRILITPMMTMDKDRAIYFEEPVGHDIQVSEVSAGEMLYGVDDKTTDRMVGDYKIVSENKARVIMAKTTLPKSGQEISWLIGEELCPVVRGNDKQQGYIWSFPTHMRQFDDTMIQLYGLKTLIQQIAPELLPKFSGKPTMMYIDGLVLAASIPQTNAIIKEWRRKEMQDAKLGL